jgi:hypothetical protein
LQIPVFVPLQFTLDHRPTHGLLDLLIVVGDLSPRDGVLKILVPIGSEILVNHSTDKMDPSNAPADPVKNPSKAVFVWIQAAGKCIVNDTSLLRLL